MRLDAPLYNPVVGYVVLTGGLACLVYLFLASAAGILLLLSNVVGLLPIGSDPVEIAEGSWAKWLSLGIAAGAVWGKGWARPTKNRAKSP